MPISDNLREINTTFAIMNNFYLPAEWEKQYALQLTWPHAGTDWNEYLDEINNTYAEMADAITRHERLIIVAPDTNNVKRLLEERLSAQQMAMLTLHECPTNDTWARDHGFISLKERDGGGIRLLDFRFNGWGEKFQADLDNRINASLHKAGTISGEYVDLNDFVLEGGSIESDGKGTVFTTSCCLLAPHRNQPMTREEIEERLKKELCADRIVWIDYGQLTGDDTDGHIDTLVRTAPDDTLVYVGCDDTSDEQFQELHMMEQQLMTLRTTDDRPYRLLRLPMPDAMYYDGERLPATYANFIIINDAVIFPTYNQPEKDLQARQVIAEAFPDREIIGIDSSIVVRQHGSLHCCSMQYPQGNEE